MSSWLERVTALTTPGAAQPLIGRLVRRFVGVIYLVAFASLAWQLEALIGPEGLEPLVATVAGFPADGGLLWHPTVFYLGAPLWGLYAAAALGTLAAAAVALDRAPRPALAVSVVLYLSFAVAAPDFFGWPPDNALIQAGALTLLLDRRGGGRWAHLLLKVLLFKVYFEAGVAKLIGSGHGGSWLDGAAMGAFQETTAVPGLLSWWVHHLPDWWHTLEGRVALVFQILGPLLFFAGRRARIGMFWVCTVFQLLLISSGSYGYLSYLMFGFHIVLLDDTMLPRWCARLAPAARLESPADSPPRSPAALRYGALALIGVWVLLGVGDAARLEVTRDASSLLRSWRVVARYSMFFHVAPERYQWEFQVHDGYEWRPAWVDHQVGDPAGPLLPVGPYHPRLTFRLWFSASGQQDTPPDEFLGAREPGFKGKAGHVARRMLSGLCERRPALERVMAEPLPDHATAARLLTWRYAFAAPEQREATGLVWQRELVGQSWPVPCPVRESTQPP